MWQAMLRFSPRLSTFSCVLALMLTTDGCRSSMRQRLPRICSLTGDNFGLCNVHAQSANLISPLSQDHMGAGAGFGKAPTRGSGLRPWIVAKRTRQDPSRKRLLHT